MTTRLRGSSRTLYPLPSVSFKYFSTSLEKIFSLLRSKTAETIVYAMIPTTTAADKAPIKTYPEK